MGATPARHRLSRLLLATALAVLLAGPAAAPPVIAAAEWCDTDPLVWVTTPGGAVVPVFVLIGALRREHLPAVLAASARLLNITVAGVTAPGGRGTQVVLAVLVEDDAHAAGFPTRATASSRALGRGVVYAHAEGTSGTAMVLTFTLPQP
jgi:hypothetical protein